MAREAAGTLGHPGALLSGTDILVGVVINDLASVHLYIH